MKLRTPPITASLDLEHAHWQTGIEHVFGLDEAGRGAWAGPVTAAAVCLPASPDIAPLLAGVYDSKKVTPLRRAALFETITRHALTWGVGIVEADKIDTIGIVPATCEAMRQALAAAHQRTPAIVPGFLLLDSIKCGTFEGVDHTPYVRGDSLSLSIAAASILAKVTRDRLMTGMDEELPLYQFGTHKGYGTAQHRAALHAHGLSPVHRRTFKPMSTLLAERLL